MAKNKLAHLVGDYQSDSDNEDSERTHRTSNDTATDWTQCTDASTGHPYYWNIVTKEVTWEIPDEYRQFLEQAQAQNPMCLKKWILCYTDDNTPYYFNEITREISWEKPEDFMQSNNSQQSNDCSTNESGHVNINENSTRATAKTKLNLVPEYNSDSDEESSKTIEKPLFPSSSNSYPTNNQPIKAIEIPNETSIESTQADDGQTPNSPKKLDEKDEPIHKEKPSFASIITGGRSPQHETVDIKLYTNQESDETSSRSEENPNETELLSHKTFQRKRRIEFKVSGAPTKRSNQIEDSSTCAGSEPSKDTGHTIANMRAKYSNFQKGETEFVEKQASSGCDDIAGVQNESNNVMKEEQQLLEAKLNFLCQGRADVSPVQVIQIQLQALQAAHVAEALHADYLLEWMKNISNDLVKLESDAAPAGWKCLWNREKAQYCYENTTTGDIKWEYPEELSENSTPDCTVIADDAMDICTTPPPNEHEDLSAAFYNANEYPVADSVPPLPPTWSTTETIKQNNEKPLDDELASFYSDIARLEPETTNEDNSCDKSPTNPEQSGSPENCVETDDKKKKKKKKSKKLEPWRSGNLETWINKWQKAQKELDG